jgi:uncharacterized protein
MDLAHAVRARVAPLFSPEGMKPYDPCHDVHHIERVARNAAFLAKAEGADVEVVVTAAWLHDLDRAGEKNPLEAARAHLAAVGASPDFTERVLEAVERHKDKSFAPGGVRPRSLEAAVLSDADKLEAIGAIGIARAFSFGGLKGRALWDGAPTDVPEVYVSGAGGTTVQHFYDKISPLDPAKAQLGPGSDPSRKAPHPLIQELAARAPALYVSGANGSTVDHFFAKLLRLKDDFSTPTGRRMAEDRHAFLVDFLSHFFAEWEGAGSS